MEAKISNIVRDKGFGFVRDSKGKEYFFHKSGCMTDFFSLKEGQSVSCKEEHSNKGPRVTEVAPI